VISDALDRFEQGSGDNTVSDARAALASLLAERAEVTEAMSRLVEQRRAATHRADTAEAERDEANAKLGAATTMLAEAEKIVPGLITTAGRFAIGLNDRERAIAAERLCATQKEALEAIISRVEDANRPFVQFDICILARAALRLGEPEKEALDKVSLSNPGAISEALHRLDAIGEQADEESRAVAERAFVEHNGLLAEADIRRETITDLRALLADVEPWILVPSDTLPQHYDKLGHVREAVRAALRLGEPPQ
jgi:chromosome segregation ATPase